MLVHADIPIIRHFVSERRPSVLTVQQKSKGRAGNCNEEGRFDPGRVGIDDVGSSLVGPIVATATYRRPSAVEMPSQDAVQPTESPHRNLVRIGL